MTDRPALYLLIPAVLLVAAVLPLPYGYYTFLRLVVTVAAAITAYTSYQTARSMTWPTIVMGLVAFLFNPVVPVALSRSVWLPIDLLTAGVFGYMALRNEPTQGTEA
ncbi:hypothetical protein EHS39_14245 [Ensifer sp. MPMI2T]|nr:hypothetical protein EHS39_14245 [Ensifer sp. MPMI2T]